MGKAASRVMCLPAERMSLHLLLTVPGGHESPSTKIYSEEEWRKGREGRVGGDTCAPKRLSFLEISSLLHLHPGFKFPNHNLIFRDPPASWLPPRLYVRNAQVL